MTRDTHARAWRAGTPDTTAPLDTLPDRAAASARADAQRHPRPTAGLARALADYQRTYRDAAYCARGTPFALTQ